MRRSRKPVWAVSSIEGSNPSLSVVGERLPAYASIRRLPDSMSWGSNTNFFDAPLSKSV
jgi:hypothetical protein